MSDSAVLLITCPDVRGLVASVSTTLYEHGANIVHADQHQDAPDALFFMRVECLIEGFDMPGFVSAFVPIAERFQMSWRLHRSADHPRVAIFVSQHLHCLADLLHRHQQGELRCSLPLILSNHTQGEALAQFYGVPFHHTPMTPEHRTASEARQIHLLEQANVDLLVLARYMQVLPSVFVARYPSAIINVHHSFLPAFVGARPYHAAFRRGVKLIGATSHYATAELDDGPIIEQDVARISHRDAVQDLIARGRDLERVVLSRAVRWHLDRRIVTYGNKTVIFD